MTSPGDHLIKGVPAQVARVWSALFVVEEIVVSDYVIEVREMHEGGHGEQPPQDAAPDERAGQQEGGGYFHAAILKHPLPVHQTN